MAYIPDVKITNVLATAIAAGTSAVNSTGVDMTGFESVIFVGVFGTGNAANIMNLAQSADNSSYADLEGSAVASSTAAYLTACQVVKPGDRYVRAEFTRGASTTLDSVIALQFGACKTPVDQPATTANEFHVSPAEGTA